MKTKKASMGKSVFLLLIIAMWVFFIATTGVKIGGVISLILTFLIFLFWGARLNGSNQAKANKYFANKYDEDKK